MSLDESLRCAASAAGGWSATAAYEVASTLMGDAGLEIDWDDKAGERWIRIVDNGRVVCLISIRMPFAFVREGKISTKNVGDHVTTIVVVDDFGEAQLSCPLVVLCEMFGGCERFEFLDPESFSPDDLWYATV